MPCVITVPVETGDPLPFLHAPEEGRVGIRSQDVEGRGFYALMDCPVRGPLDDIGTDGRCNWPSILPVERAT